MTLLDVLAWTSSASLFGGAMAAAPTVRAGSGGYVVAVAVGALLGAGNAWAVYQTGFALGRLLIGVSDSQQTVWGVAFAIVIFAWMPVASFLGGRAASAIVGLMFAAP